DLLALRDPADPRRVEDDDADRGALDELAKGPARAERLARRGRHARRLREPRERVEVVHPDRVLEPRRLVVLERTCDPDRTRQVPERVELDHQLDAVADRLAHLAKRLDALAQILERDRLAARGLRVRIEWPDLHAGDALLEQALGERSRIGQEPVEVLV